MLFILLFALLLILLFGGLGVAISPLFFILLILLLILAMSGGYFGRGRWY